MNQYIYYSFFILIYKYRSQNRSWRFYVPTGSQCTDWITGLIITQDHWTSRILVRSNSLFSSCFLHLVLQDHYLPLQCNMLRFTFVDFGTQLFGLSGIAAFFLRQVVPVSDLCPLGFLAKSRYGVLQLLNLLFVTWWGSISWGGKIKWNGCWKNKTKDLAVILFCFILSFSISSSSWRSRLSANWRSFDCFSMAALFSPARSSS